MYEVHISHYMTARTGEKPKGPRRQHYVRLQKIWPSILDKVNIQEDTNIFDWSTLQVDSALQALTTEALEFGKGLLHRAHLHGAHLLVVITENCVSSLFII